MPLPTQDRIRFSNRLGIIIAGTGLFLMGVYTYLGRNNMQALIIMSLFGLLVPFLNRLGAGMFVRILLSLAPATTVTFFDISLKKVIKPENLEIISYITPRYVVLGSIMLPLVLFTHKERWLRYSLVLLLLVLVFSFDALFRFMGVHFTQISPNLTSKAYNLQWINMLIVATTLLSTTSFLIYTNRKNEENNQRILAETLSINLRLQESENKLKETLEVAEKSKAELEQKSYVSTGLAHFLQLLRKEKDFEKLSDVLLSNLASYLGVQQGALYWLRQEVLELKAGYALPETRIKNNTFLPQEGLIGASFSQKKILHVVDVLEKNTTILSGLGVGKAREIIFVPLIFDDKTVGVMELATFHTFKSYQIELIEQVAEASATSLVNLEVAKRSDEMLNELQKFKSKVNYL